MDFHCLAPAAPIVVLKNRPTIGEDLKSDSDLVLRCFHADGASVQYHILIALGSFAEEPPFALVGTIILHYEERPLSIYLQRIEINHERDRRKGIGTLALSTLIKHWISRLKLMGRALTLYVPMNKPDIISWYERFGFSFDSTIEKPIDFPMKASHDTLKIPDASSHK